MSRLARLPFMQSARVKKVFKDACERYDLVYFGFVSQHKDEHEMVRGFTLSPSHVDQHYCVGTVASRDMILLQRTETVSFPAQPSKAYTWTVLQVDLRRNDVVHTFLNSTDYDEIIYKQLFAKFQHMSQVNPGILVGYDAQFLNKFRVYASPQRLDEVLRQLRPEIAAMIGHHFAGIDVEYYGDQLILYIQTNSPTKQDIDNLMRLGVWLAEQIDS